MKITRLVLFVLLEMTVLGGQGQIAQEMFKKECKAFIKVFPGCTCMDGKNLRSKNSNLEIRMYSVNKYTSKMTTFNILVHKFSQIEQKKILESGWKLTRSLAGPGIIKIVGQQWEKDVVYTMVPNMRFLGSEIILSRGSTSKFIENDFGHQLKSLFQALERIHANGYVMTNLSADAIVLNDDLHHDQMMLLDLSGLARKGSLFEPRDDEELTDPLYWVERERPNTIDSSNDIFAMGVIIYRLLMKQKNFWDHSDDLSWEQRVREGNYTLPKGVDVTLAFLISKCLQYQKERRITARVAVQYITAGEGIADKKYLEEPVTLTLTQTLNPRLTAELEENHIMLYGTLEQLSEVRKRKKQLEYENTPFFLRIWRGPGFPVLIIVIITITIVLTVAYFSRKGHLDAQKKTTFMDNSLGGSAFEQHNESSIGPSVSGPVLEELHFKDNLAKDLSQILEEIKNE